jgi:hypothetical protein
MKTLFVLLTFFLLLISLQAHPSWAFIMDENEKIYLVDLLTDDGTLMQIDLKTQELKVVATGFHCHSMHLGKDGNIYAGLNIWRQGEIEGEGHNYLICIDTEDGSLDTLLFSERYLDYFGADIAMTEDLSTVLYIYQNHIYAKALPNKPTRKWIDHTFKKASTIALDGRGDLWIADTREQDGTLFRWNKKEGLQAVASGLIPARPEHPVFEERRHHLFFGIGFNEKGDPLVTESADRKVVEVLPFGKKRLIYQSDRNWHPLRAFEYKGQYYVLETGWQSGKGFLDSRIRILNEQLEVEKTVIVHTKRRELEVEK